MSLLDHKEGVGDAVRRLLRKALLVLALCVCRLMSLKLACSNDSLEEMASRFFPVILDQPPYSTSIFGVL
jgi:hypothetical protein